MGKFVVKEGKSGKRFDLVAGNGQIIGVSQSYSSEEACYKGIDSVRRNACAPVEDQTVPDFQELKHPKFEMYRDKAGEYRYRLLASNGQNILSGQGYKEKSSCRKGIESVGSNAPEAAVEEEGQA